MTETGLVPALGTAARMAAVLGKHALLEPSSLEWDWFERGRGGLGVHTRLGLMGSRLDDPELAEQARACRPVGHPAAEMSALLVTGPGERLDAEGEPRREPRLVELTVSPDPYGCWAEVAVHHDVWSPCDFGGEPHPAVHANNAPRLAAALRALDALLGVPGEPGEPTYFGVAEGHGLKAPELVDGLGPDLTDLL
ncbi:hypothetical protein [Streptomyces gobitricini]|uniref:hypothetical protein n=1 Tax=Streptomyces gobitricini TaxID=68211 RepID=UPI0031D7D7A7